MTTNTDGVPAPEARVRAFLEAQDQENARIPATTDELAWAVPDDAPLVALTLSDLRDTVAELGSLRDLVDAIMAEAEVGLRRGGVSYGSTASLTRIQQMIRGDGWEIPNDTARSDQSREIIDGWQREGADR